MNAFTQAELNKLSVMYEGDKNRDASSKIRGFLFQDYVTIRFLLEPDVIYVCSEYLEDVNVFLGSRTLKFIQVKYYPKTKPKMKEIITDFYYQYLRLQMLNSTLEPELSLYIYSENVEEPTLEDMIKYVGLEEKLLPTVIYSSVEQSRKWLKENIYVLRTKEEQKKALFSQMASAKSLQLFKEKFSIQPQTDINQYKKNLMEELAKTYPNSDQKRDNMHWQLILLGLAINYIHKRYSLNETDFEKIRVDKKEFDCYMTESVRLKTEQTVISYLVGIICEKYGEIIIHNNLSDLQIYLLNLIYQKTVKWISELCQSIDGQYQLVNTISIDEVDKVSGYKRLSVENRLINMAENKRSFRVFLGYLWKIMLNICQESISDENEIFEDSKLIDPLHYINASITDYICLNFPEDRYVDHCVILPSAGGEFRGLKRKIIGRALKMTPRPEKWYFENSKISKGENFYDYYTANVNKTLTVADLGKEGFYIECMDCITVDEDDWQNIDTCGKCIFSERCVKEGYRYDFTGRV